MTSRRGLHWLALATLLGTACDKTLSFDPPASASDGGEPGSGGTAGTAGSGDWQKGGSSGKDSSPTGGTGFIGNEDCQSLCASIGQRCDESEQACVECIRDQDCESRGLYCHGFLNRCVGCREKDAAGCPNNQWCDDDGQCREPCLTQAHPDDTCRSESQFCEESRNVCISCWEDEHCEGSPDGPHCLPGGARCAQCAFDKHCGRERPRCDPVLFRCVECADSRDCALPLVCDPVDHYCTDPFFVPLPT